ncbi:MAG TPA: HEAT repeat domain-containing protein [Chryseosolibacter sp.]|nr:HEAT repeat domain-containing protein [Chryseosolibacter sp.]
MNDMHIRDLIQKFNAGNLTTAEQLEFERLIEAGQVDPATLEALAPVGQKLDSIEFPSPSADLDDRFYRMLALQKRQARSGFSWSQFFSWPEFAPKLAFASIALVIGIAVGYWVKPAPGPDVQYARVTNELAQLREMMMLSLLEKESATERLKAVNLTQEMHQVSNKVTGALIQTLNSDENVNVRLAALEALVPYAKDVSVRTELIRSIGRQDSPLVQMALAELMEQIQEKKSIRELQKIIQSDKTPEEVKDRIKESIKVLS